MKFGVHIALWMKTWNDDIIPYLDEAARLGFEGAELSLLGMTDTNITHIRRVLHDLRLDVTCTTGLSEAHDITSADPAIRRAGVQYLESAIRTAEALGSPLLSGVIYAPWGKRTMAHRTERWERSVKALKQIAPLAAAHGVTLGIEAVNRFETDLVNTAAQASGMADAIGEPNVGVLLDTYHMNIEEKNLGEALRKGRHTLVHLHAVENDRGAPGSGHVPWEEVATALREIRYDGWVTLEMFIQANQPVSPDLAIWRTIEDDPTDAAARGLSFLREALI